MPQEKVKRIHLIYGCVLAVLIVALGVAMILSCLDIYNSGPRPYSAESIAMRFNRIAVLVYLTIVATAGGIVLNLIIPLESKRPKALRDDAEALLRLRAKADTEAAGSSKEPKLRWIYRIVTAVIFTGLMVYPAIYFANVSHFTISNLNADIIKAVVIVMIPAAVGLGLCFVCSMLVRSSIRREMDFYKKVPRAQKSKDPLPKRNRKLLIIRCVVLAVAVCFIVLGVINGGIDDVLSKAIAICTECIGLG